MGVLALLMIIAGAAFQSSDFGATSHRSSPAPRTYLGAKGLEDAEGDGGAFVSAVSPPGGPLDRAGLIGGDVIKEFDGKTIADEDDLNTLLENIPEAKAATLTYSRDGEILKATVTTASEEEIERLRDASDNRAEGKGYLGVDDLERVKIPGTENYGVKIGEVKKNRPADIAGLKDGDIVRQFNDLQIRTEDEFRMRCERAAPASTVSLTVIRSGETLVIPVKMGGQ
ncbi:MAG: PDZ domain-containing protein [Pyrinomonadaceae bacterium]